MRKLKNIQISEIGLLAHLCSIHDLPGCEHLQKKDSISSYVKIKIFEELVDPKNLIHSNLFKTITTFSN